MPEDISNLKIKEDNFVNDATLELLQRRIESNIRGNLMKTLAIPSGAGGVLAIVITLAFLIPQRIDTILDNPASQKVLADEIHQQIAKYFEDPESREKILLVVEGETLKQARGEASKTINEYLNSEKGRAVLTQTIQLEFAGPSNQELIRSLVDNYLKQDGRELLIDEIERTLRPAAEVAASTIDENRKRLVEAFDPQALAGDPKRSVEFLQEYLSPASVRMRIDRGMPIVLTKTVRQGNAYDASVIRSYLTGFRDRFGELFRFVSVSYGLADNKEVLIALIPSDRFERQFDRIANKFVDLLNSANDSVPATEEQVRQQIVQWFGPEVTRVIRADWQVDEALTNRQVWTEPFAATDEVAVVDKDGRLIAATSRRRMVEGLLRNNDNDLN